MASATAQVTLKVGKLSDLLKSLKIILATTHGTFMNNGNVLCTQKYLLLLR